MLLYVIYAYFNKMSRIADIIQFIYKIPELIQFYRSDFYKNLFEVPDKKNYSQNIPNTRAKFLDSSGTHYTLKQWVEFS